jgi:hypothetical protein
MMVFGPLWFVVAVIAIYFIFSLLNVYRLRPRWDPNRFNTAPLPTRSAEQLKARDDASESHWVTYNGRTPPLRLKVRGNSYEGFRRVCRKYIDSIGQDHFDRLAEADRVQFMLPVMAEAHVLDWDGAQYQNGTPMPYSPANLALFMAEDQHLIAFVAQEGGRISPRWPGQ